jgi:hypothetical protein
MRVAIANMLAVGKFVQAIDKDPTFKVKSEQLEFDFTAQSTYFVLKVTEPVKEEPKDQTEKE